MPDLKDSWKETGNELLNGFKGLSRSVIKSVKAGVSKENWEGTGSGLSNGFKSFGKSFVKTVKFGAEKAVEWAESKENKNVPEEEGSVVDAEFVETTDESEPK